jgi:heme-degrading monooxygenase HmoA
MYGTVAKMRAKRGSGTLLAEIGKQLEGDRPPGMVSVFVYRMDANPDEYVMAVAFESKEAYEANAASDEQDRRYRQLRELLESDPEWNDGEIVHVEGPAARPSEAPAAGSPA